MQELPHRYTVSAAGMAEGDVELKAVRLPTLHSASPVEFGGPGNRWSPETLLVAAVGDCLILTFRAVADAFKLAWTSLDCEVTGMLDRRERTPQFTDFEIHAHLRIPVATDQERARRALEKAEKNCLISNSLKSAVHLTAMIEVVTASASELIAV
jgi:uncharacterized OsmC-like protein